MEDAIEGFSLFFRFREGAFEERAVGEVAFDKFNTLRQKVAGAVAEVIENDGLVTALCEEAGDGTSDVPCTACNENLHENLSPG
jgi:hypothetical protein